MTAISHSSASTPQGAAADVCRVTKKTKKNTLGFYSRSISHRRWVGTAAKPVGEVGGAPRLDLVWV